MSDINRNNYETFFLLYTDNELSVTEKKLVDEFLHSNPDLQEELVMLQQSILKPDHIIFEDKAGLFMYELSTSGVREKLLLLLDNELPATEKNEMEELIKADAGIEKEWTMLQQTKLLPVNEIVFNDKQSLYRKEQDRIVNFAWWRVSAAAAFIGFGILGGLVYFNKTVHLNNGIAKNIEAKIKPDNVKPATQQIMTPVDSTTDKEQETALTQVISRKKIKPIVKQPGLKPAASTLQNSELETIAVKEKTNNLPKPYFENVNRNSSNKTVSNDVKPENQPSSIVNPGNNALVKNAGKQDPANSYAAVTSYSDDSEDNNNRVLFMDEEKVKKTKLGGIFRKVKRVLERSTNIKPGGNNNIKVANMEFAIQ